MDRFQEHSFVNVIEVEIWCKCGNQYTVMPLDERTFYRCDVCGRGVDIQFSLVFEDAPPLRGVPNE